MFCFIRSVLLDSIHCLHYSFARAVRGLTWQLSRLRCPVQFVLYYLNCELGCEPRLAPSLDCFLDCLVRSSSVQLSKIPGFMSVYSSSGGECRAKLSCCNSFDGRRYFAAFRIQDNLHEPAQIRLFYVSVTRKKMSCRDICTYRRHCFKYVRALLFPLCIVSSVNTSM
ncbi:hypothetical protein MTO96_049383 [Rhipicephalus appendiculatus]